MASGAAANPDATLLTEIEFENDIKKDPYALKYWWRYLQYKHKAPAKERNMLHERALSKLPGSYKLWFQYLDERMLQVKDRPVDDAAWELVNTTFERALIFMSKMPRMWQEFVKFLALQGNVTRTRHAIDRALQGLPVTQHEKVWKVAIDFMKQDHIPPETVCRLWKRYLQLEPHQVEDYIAYLRRFHRWNDVINEMIKALNDPRFVSVKGKTRHELWVDLCTLLSKQGDTLKLEDTNLSVDRVVRSGIKRFPNEVGQLWCALADFNIRCGRFDKARDIYEEAITSVTTVKDFIQVFESYSKFEDSLLQAKMERLADLEEEDSPGGEEGTDDTDAYTAALLKVTETNFDLTTEVDYRIERLEHLMERRPELLNAVLLRQNPHNVHEWHTRVEIFAKDPQKVVKAYTEAVTTVDIAQAIGKPHTLWTSFARWYEKQGDLRSARIILEKAVKEPFKGVDDLASVWCDYAEMELRGGNFRKALDLLRRVTATNFSGQGSWKKLPGQPVQERVWRSVKLWSFYADLNESLCTIRSTKNVYDRMIYLKVATPQIILNFAQLMKENNYWEEAFKAYQQGITLFPWPVVNDLWVAYLSTFVTRFKGRKVERMRDLFEQCIAKVPKDHATRFYLMYARFEERFGLARQCLAVYDRACDKVANEDIAPMFRRYLAAAEKFFGKIKTRDVFEKAIRKVSEKEVPALCMEYAQLETELGEIDRARALYAHAAQYVDPAKENTFWPAWHAFEVSHGNTDTGLEMIKVRRSVQATFAATIDFAAIADAAREKRKRKLEEESGEAAPDGPAGQPAQKKQAASKYTSHPDAQIVFVPQQQAADLAQAENDGADEQNEVEIEAKTVPDSVFAAVKSSSAK